MKLPKFDSLNLKDRAQNVLKPKTIFILIRSLNVGGAERQASILAQSLHRKGHKVTVGLFYAGGEWEEKLREAGVAIHYLYKKGRWDLIGWFGRYLKAIREVNPEVIYSFLPVSNIVSVIGKLFIRKPVVWGIRASNMNLQDYDWLATVSVWIEKKLSPYADCIIFNARYSQAYHQSLGYCIKKATVIPNGIDTETFKPASQADKKAIRDRLKIPQEAFVVGMLARVDPMKDYETFLTAARALSSKHKKLYFIAAGSGTDTAPWGALPSHFLRLGLWEDMSALLNILNVMVLSSLGEGFPNIIGEAMACGVLPIVTDVGDASYIVEDQGIVIPPKDPPALIHAIESLLQSAPSVGGLRNRILSHFSVSQMVDNTLKILRKACKE